MLHLNGDIELNQTKLEQNLAHKEDKAVAEVEGLVEEQVEEVIDKEVNCLWKNIMPQL